MTTIQPGDTVRVIKAINHPVGTEFVVKEVVPSGESFYVTGDPHDLGVWVQYLEVVEPIPADPRHESLIREVESLNAALRRRNETITSLREELREAKAKAESPLEELAEKAGLKNAQAEHALEIGAWAIAHGHSLFNIQVKLLGYDRTKVELANLREKLNQPVDVYAALTKLQKQVGKANAEKGFHDRGDKLREKANTPAIEINQLFEVKNQGAKRVISRVARDIDTELRDYYTARLALIPTEISEAIEHLRDGRAVDEIFYETTPAGEKPDGVGTEVVDSIIRALDFLDEVDLDAGEILKNKLAYNAKRERMNGRKF